ncbi:MAG TPA: hypothetical protein V6C72_19990 [Chroococcales cyanobacterium]
MSDIDSGRATRHSQDGQSALSQQWHQQDGASLTQPLNLDSNGQYTTQFGDCLSSIAERALHGMGQDAPSHAQVLQEEAQIIRANSNRYDSLAQNADRLDTGWQLVIPPLGAQNLDQHPQLGSQVPRNGNYYDNSSVPSYYDRTGQSQGGRYCPPDQSQAQLGPVGDYTAGSVPIQAVDPVNQAYQSAMARTYGEYGTVNAPQPNINAIEAYPIQPSYEPNYGFSNGYYGHYPHRFPHYPRHYSPVGISGSGYYPGNESVIVGPAGATVMDNPAFPPTPGVASSMGDLNAIASTILPIVNAGAGIYMGIESANRYNQYNNYNYNYNYGHHSRRW